MSKDELIEAIDEELDNCIKKFRNAVYGNEVRTFVTEYEELMLKKSDLVTQGFIKKDHEEHEKRQTIRRTQDDLLKEAKNMVMCLAALQIVQGIVTAGLTLCLLMQ